MTQIETTRSRFLFLVGFYLGVYVNFSMLFDVSALFLFDFNTFSADVLGCSCCYNYSVTVVVFVVAAATGFVICLNYIFVFRIRFVTNSNRNDENYDNVDYEDRSNLEDSHHFLARIFQLRYL